MTRLFAFGCSFTNYRWSTWADALAPEFDSFENWGQAGGGNHYIFNSIMEAHQRYRFGPNDTVIVCWTTHLREDRYIKNRWITPGSIMSATVYDPKFLTTHCDERGSVIHDMAFIKSVKVLLESCENLNWKFMSLNTRTQPYHDGPNDVLDLYKDVLDCFLPSFEQVLHPTGWPPREDPHPSPAEHLAYLDVVLPGWVTKESTRVIMHEESINLNKDPRKSGMTKVTRL
jgi:hypothetical protein